MNELNISELHNALLILLKKFSNICSKYGINYSIGYGTMLGAIRHKGFIPWDDDVDIMITRAEYEKLLKVPTTEYGESFFFQTVNTDPGYPYNTARLRLNNTSMIYDRWINSGFHQGIYIDIIVFDNVPDSKTREYFQKFGIIFFSMFRFLRNKNIFMEAGTNIPLFLKKILFFCFHRFPLDKIYKREVSLEKKYSGSNTKKMAFLGEGNLFLKNFYAAKPISSSCFDKYCMIKFEDTELMCTTKYEELLEQWYGNYMKLPPEEKRVIYHQPVFFSTSVSYKNYISTINNKK